MESRKGGEKKREKKKKVRTWLERMGSGLKHYCVIWVWSSKQPDMTASAVKITVLMC